MLTPKVSVRNMQPYAGPGEGRLDALRLDFNENVLGPSPKVLEAIRSISRDECACYPEYERLNQALSQYLRIEEECLIASNGSDEALKMIFDTYVEQGDEVILLTPSYSMYELYANVAGARILRIPFADENFDFPLESILAAIRPHTKLIAIANPNNPTGRLINRKELIKIIEANPNMGVLIDEAYATFAKITNQDLAVRYRNVFITQTFSKAYGLAGLRIGYLISSAENIQAVSKVLSPSYSVDCVAAAAAIAALQDRAYVETYIEEVSAAREEFSQALKSLGFHVIPSEANFLLVRFGKWAKKIKDALREQRILVRERSDLEGFLRITIGTKEQMRKVLCVVRFVVERPALIFDMDGVLVDESQSYRPCIVKTAEFFLGFQIDPLRVEQLKQKGGYNNDYDCIEAILREYGKSVKREELCERFDAFYEELKFSEKWLPDTQLLMKLKTTFLMGIFTGRPKRDAFDALKRFSKESIFDVVITDDDVNKRKPDPEGLLLAMQRLNVKKAIYFGDSKDDCEAARRASVEFVEVKPPGVEINQMMMRFL